MEKPRYSSHRSTSKPSTKNTGTGTGAHSGTPSGKKWSTPTQRLDLSKLNARQREAATFGDGPLLVLAGAGSGKTSTMAYRMAYLVANKNIHASQILGLSFTRKAAIELKERVTKLITQVSGKGATRGITLTTFHALCVRILRKYATKIGFDTHFTILDRTDQVDLVREILRNLKLDDRRFDPDVLLFEIGQAKNKFLSVEQANDYFLNEARTFSPDYAIIAANIFEKYQAQLKALSSMDFDDLLYLAVSLLEQHEDVRREYNDKYRYILVDEYQDTNPAQSKLLALLTQKTQNLCVVGDDDQSIYAWRGADPAHILKFAKHYPSAKVITLDQNYRSTNTILEAANHLISQNKVRHAKTLWSDKGQGQPITELIVEHDRHEAEVVAEDILKLSSSTIEGARTQTRAWKDFAILYRSNPQSRLFEEALRMRQIPYKLVGAMSFLDRKEVKDTLSYWRLVVNPKDDASARRVINWPARAIGKSSIEAISSHAVAAGQPFFESLRQISTTEGEHTLTPRAQQSARAFRTLITELRRDLEQTPLNPAALSQWALHSLKLIGVKEALLKDYPDDPLKAQRNYENVEELANAFGQLNLNELSDAETTVSAQPRSANKPSSLSFDFGAEMDADTSELSSAAMSEARENNFSETTAAHRATPQGVDSVTALREYLARMTLGSLDEEDENQKPKDEVTLLTFHGAKGLEYPVVYMVGMEEGLLPHRRTIEEASDFSEERRLAYVGITRAKETLYLVRAKTRIRYGKAVPRTPSRFLEEVPKHLLVTQNESTSPDLSSTEAREKHETKVKDFLAEIRNRLAAGK